MEDGRLARPAEQRSAILLSSCARPPGRGRPSLRGLQFFQLTLCFLPQHSQFLRPFSHALDNFGWGLRQKLLVRQLPLAVGDFFLDLFQLFFQTFTFSAHINLLLINYVDIESRRRASPGQASPATSHESETFNIGQPLDGAAILIQQRS